MRIGMETIKISVAGSFACINRSVELSGFLLPNNELLLILHDNRHSHLKQG